MDVSICIVNWNTCNLLSRCIESIYSRTTQLEYEIVVVDNNSSDGSVEYIQRMYPDVRLIASPRNLGFARGCNLALEYVVGRYVLYLNPDTEIVTNAIAGMSGVLDKWPGISAVGCRLQDSDGSVQFTCACDPPSPWNELCELLGLHRAFPRSAMFSGRELTYWDHRDSRDVQCLSGACLMVRRELIDTLGGLDESLFMYGEDVDLCMRINGAGGRLYYVASEIIFHHEGAGSRKRGRDFASLRQRAANNYVLKKHFGRGRAFRYRVAVFIGSCIRCIGAIIIAPAAVTLMNAAARERVLRAIERYGCLSLWALGLRKVDLSAN